MNPLFWSNKPLWRSGISTTSRTSWFMRMTLIALFLALFTLRAVYPLADPPENLSWSLGLFFDEGIYNHNARNQALFGEWELDEWNDAYYSILSAWIKYAVFWLFGVGRLQVRFITIVFSWCSLIWVYLGVQEGYNRKTAVLATVLLGADYIYIMYNRLGLQDSQTVAIFTLTFFLWQRAMNRFTSQQEAGHAWWKSWAGYFFWAGVSCVLMYTFKNLFLFLVPVPFAAFVIFALMKRDVLGLAKVMRAFLFLSGGALSAFLLWYLAFYRHYQEEIARIGEFMMTHRMFPSDGFKGYLANLVNMPFFQYFSRNPILVLSTFLVLLGLWFLFWSDFRSRIHAADLFTAAWFAATFLFLGLLSYRPLRWYLPVIPPMCILTARMLVFLISNISIKVPRVYLPGFFPGLGVWLFIVSYTCIFPWLLLYGGIDLPQRLGITLEIASLMAALCGSAAILMLFRRKPRLTVRIPAYIGGLPAACLLLCSLYLNGSDYYQWAKTPQYAIDSVGRDLMTLLGNDAYIGGLDAPAVAFDTPYKTLYSWPQFVNDEDPIHTYQLTHLFLADSQMVPERATYFRHYPEAMQRAVLLKNYTIKQTLFHLYSLVEPEIEDVRIAKTRYAPHEVIRVEAQVTHSDFRTGRYLLPNWYLFPVPLPFEMEHIPSGQGHRRWFEPEEEQRITITGAAPAVPGEYRLLFCVTPWQQQTVEAEQKRRHIGVVMPDLMASGNQMVVHDHGHPGFLTYGFYRTFHRGYYETRFRLKVADNTLSDEVVRLEVALKGQPIQQIQLRGVDFTDANTYQDFVLPYMLHEYTRDIEFRVYSHGNTMVWVDKMHTVYQEGFWMKGAIIVD